MSCIFSNSKSPSRSRSPKVEKASSKSARNSTDSTSSSSQQKVEQPPAMPLQEPEIKKEAVSEEDTKPDANVAGADKVEPPVVKQEPEPETSIPEPVENGEGSNENKEPEKASSDKDTKSNANAKGGEDYPPSRIEGFEDWSLPMIRDFIACMDTARKKYATLKEQDPNGQVKLVPLLLDEWKVIYPESAETVKTFLSKIKHLKLQKEVIKKHLGTSGLLPKMDGTLPDPKIKEDSSEDIGEAELPPRVVIKPEPSATTAASSQNGGGRSAKLKSSQSRSNSLDSPAAPAFKWNKEMITDVIESRKSALKIKDDEHKKGNKVSFHSLWAAEFKKFHPNSTFTSNNLSVHFWTWRKQQQKLQAAAKKEQDKLDQQLKQRMPKQIKSEVKTEPSPFFSHHEPSPPSRRDSLSRSSSSSSVSVGPGRPPGGASGTFKDARARERLLAVGRRVEQMMQDPDTPNDIKVQGFANVLHKEWAKVSPRGATESSRSLNMMYSRLIKQGERFEDEEDRPATIMATWTPKHNGVLKNCMEEPPSSTSETYPEFMARVIKNWRKKFPKSSVTDEDLTKKVHDLLLAKDSPGDSTDASSPLTKTEALNRMAANVKMEVEDSNSNGGSFTEIPLGSSRRSSSSVMASDSSGGGTNNRGQMNWTHTAIRDLVDAHRSAVEEQKLLLTSTGKKGTPKLSELVHARFTHMHPYCKLSPAILMTKCYTYRGSLERGEIQLSIAPRTADQILAEIKSEPFEVIMEDKGTISPPSGNNKPASRIKRSSSRDLVFRTWTQEMIDDMLTTRKIALAKKKKLNGGNNNRNKSDHVVTLTDIWYEEFLKLHPTYSSTKKNLWRKYKWYKSRMAQVSGEETEMAARSFEVKTETETPVASISSRRSSEQQQPVLKMRAVRKDVFHYLKAVLEESRIFLPLKLPEGPPPPPPAVVQQQPIQLVAPVTSGLPQQQQQLIQTQQPPLLQFQLNEIQEPPQLPVITNPQDFQASQTLAAFHQQAVHGGGEGMHVVQALPTLPTVTTMIQPLTPADAVIQSAPIPMPISIQQMAATTTTTTEVPTVVATAEPAEAICSEDANNGNNGSNNDDSIKLPGGATLVAVTDRNADILMKPKQLEKPHVTITIGENNQQHQVKNEPEPMEVVQPQHLIPETQLTIAPQQPQQPHQLTAIMSTPTAQIPLAIPCPAPINVPQFRSSLTQPPPLPNLKPPFSLEAVTTPGGLIIPAKVKTTLDELGMSDQNFSDLLDIYTKVREEFIGLLKRGFLVFFPYLLGTRWREQNPTSCLTGRKLTAVIDLYVEERSRGRMNNPEYLTKVPCGFVLTELMLKQIMIHHADVKHALGFTVMAEAEKLDNNQVALIYAEMCKRWARIHPDIRLTTKQLVSIHHMLNFEPGKTDPSPEVSCLLTEVFRILERDVPKERSEFKQFETNEDDLYDHEFEDLEEYDEDNMSMEHLQEMFLSTRNLDPFPMTLKEKQQQLMRAGRRPHMAMKKQRLFWSKRRLDHLFQCVIKARKKFRIHMRPFRVNQKKMNLQDEIFKIWRAMNANDPVALRASKTKIIARYVWQLRMVKAMNTRMLHMQIRSWETMCDNFRIHEENVEVIDEEVAAQIKMEEEMMERMREAAANLASQPHSGERPSFNISKDSRDYNRDEDVLSYIKESQAASKSQHNITWTPDVIYDLIEARREARRRKKAWEEWAIKKYGGIGVAYNNPDVKFSKVRVLYLL